MRDSEDVLLTHNKSHESVLRTEVPVRTEAVYLIIIYRLSIFRRDLCLPSVWFFFSLKICVMFLSFHLNFVG